MSIEQAIAAAQENVKIAMEARTEASIAYYTSEGEEAYEKMEQAFAAANAAQDALDTLLAAQ